MKVSIHPLRIKKLKTGDVFSATIEIENQKITKEVIKALEGRELFGGLILNNLIIENDNNVTADIFITNDQLRSNEVLNVESVEVALELKMPKIESYTSEATELVVLEQSSSHLNWSLIVGIVLFLILIIYLKRNTINDLFANKSKRLKEKNRKEFVALIKNADHRKDFEEIYLSHHQWESLIGHDKDLWENFANVLNRYQFRPTWESWQLDEVKKAYGAFRGSLR